MGKFWMHPYFVFHRSCRIRKRFRISHRHRHHGVRHHEVRALRETGTGEEQGRFIVGRAAEAVGHDEEALACRQNIAVMTHSLPERSYTKILVTDHAKIGRPSFAQLCPITTMDKIVTDKEADPEFVRKAQRLGLEVVQV